MAPFDSSSSVIGLETGPASALDVRHLVRTLFGCWRLFLFGLTMTLVGLVLLIRFWPEQYSAAMVVGPVSESGTAAMGPRVPMPPIDRTAALVEYGSAEETLSDYSRFLGLLTTSVVAQRLLSDDSLMRRLFPDRWDADAQRWRPPGGLSGRLRRVALWLVGWEDWTVPDATAVARHLRRVVGREMVAGGPMHRIRVRHADRATALALLSALYRTADRHLRDEAARRGHIQLAHLEEHLKTVRASSHREALGEIRAEFQRLIMMLEVDLPFAADLIEPPSAPQRPEWPDKIALLLLVPPTALVVALLLVFVRIVWLRGRC